MWLPLPGAAMKKLMVVLSLVAAGGERAFGWGRLTGRTGPADGEEAGIGDGDMHRVGVGGL